MTELSDEQKANLQRDWGMLSHFSDFKPGEHITYRLASGEIASGLVIWVTGPSESHVIGRDDNLPLRYIVERIGWEGSIPDVVYSADIIS